MKSKLNIALVQINLCWEDIDCNLKEITKIIEGVNKDTDLIILPEMFSTGFTMDVDSLEKPIGKKSFEWLKETAERSNISIIGSILTEEKGEFYNRMYLMNPDGTDEQYDKRHLFHMAGEHHIMTAGKERKIVNFKGWKLNLQVCYDLRFPVWSKNNYDSSNGIYDYDALVYIANWPQVRRQAYLPLLQARAIENQSYVLWTNRVGEDGKKIAHSGDTRVLDPYGKVDKSLSEGEEAVLYASMSSDVLGDFREKFKVGLDWDSFQVITT